MLLGFDVVALWDPGANDLESEAECMSIEFSSQFEDDVLLHREIGLLLVLCAPSYHAQLAVKALGIAKHVYVQPPCAISATQTLRMLQSASYYPNLVAVVGTLRSLPAVQEMKRLMNENYLGTPLHCDIRLNSPNSVSKSKYSWRCREDMGGGVLNQFGFSILDLVLNYLLQQKAVRVHAVFRTLQTSTSQINGIRHITADDVASLLIETDKNCLITMNLNGCSSKFSQELSISSQSSQLVIRDQSLYGRKFAAVDNNDMDEIFYLDTNLTSSKPGSTNQELPPVFLEGFSSMFNALRAIFDSPEKDSKNFNLFASFEDSYHISRIIQAARQSSLNKTWVNVVANEN